MTESNIKNDKAQCPLAPATCWTARPETPRTNAAVATTYSLPDGGWPTLAGQLERELGDENARVNHYRHKWQDAELEIQKLKDALAALSNKYCVDHLRPIRAASGLIFPSLYWQSGFVNVILHGMADWKPNCEKPQTPLGRFIPNPKLKFMEQCR
jgi:hypothetical protein